MKTKEIFSRNNIGDLERELASSREELREFRFSASQSKIKNVKSGREIKHIIARLLTRINQLKRK